VFTPTLAEFRDPIAYITSIEASAEKFGICRIIPPSGWKPDCLFSEKNNPGGPFNTRSQLLHRLQEAVGFNNGKRYSNLREYAEAARRLYSSMFEDRKVSVEELEATYWRIVEQGSQPVEVEYGNDVCSADWGSGFEFLTGYTPGQGDDDKRFQFSRDADAPETARAYKGCQSWNLNLIPSKSLLGHLKAAVSGVTVPWMYFGMLFSTFCWHNEDDYLHSINFMHFGQPKTWYGIPGQNAKSFEKAIINARHSLFKNEPDLLFKLVTMISPRELQASQVPVYHTVQEPGQFVITFPRAYHAGFSHGFNFAEAVNFATDSWFSHFRDCSTRYRQFSRASVCSGELLLFACAINDPLDKHDQRILSRELDLSIETEIKMRSLCANKAIPFTRIPGLLQTAHSVFHIDCSVHETIPTCCECKHFNFLSHLVCSGCNAIYCLGHLKQVLRCPCRLEGKQEPSITLFVRFTNEELLFIRNRYGSDASLRLHEDEEMRCAEAQERQGKRVNRSR
jgi:hypothetical protein